MVTFICAVQDGYSQNYLDKIVIDAGHGGKDPGALGSYSKEKDVVLKIALQTGKLIKQAYPDIEIIYTRDKDIFVPLKDRAEIANAAKADLFVSIHCNSHKSKQPQGSETYVMGLHKSEANLEVAKKENAAILLEEDYEQTYEGFNPNSDEGHIIFNFFQNSFLSNNLDLASKIQNEFSEKTSLKDRGVKQAGFWVLYKTTMPGVLVETGFLSNPKDEKFLNSKEGQAKLSEAIAKAVGEYKKDHDARERQKDAQVTEIKKETEAGKEGFTQLIDSSVTSTTKTEYELVEGESADNGNIVESAPEDKAYFYVQFLSLSSEKDLTAAKYDKLKPVSSYYHKGMYRYITGGDDTIEKASKKLRKVKKLGFKDAFIIALYNEKRISIEEAKSINN